MELSVIKMGICLSAPLLLMMILTKGEARWLNFFLILGFAACSLSDVINGYIMEHMSHYSIKVFGAYYSPVVEEVVKMIPILIYSIVTRKKKRDSFIVGMSVGVGFAILENVYYMITNAVKISSIEWIFARGFATALMHAICTGVVAYMLSVAYTHKKMYVTGTIAALAMAMTYHSIYNIMIQTSFQNLILLMPIITYGIILCVRKKELLLIFFEKIQKKRR